MLGSGFGGRRCTQLRNSSRTNAIKARWTLHTRFGRRTETLELVQEWVKDVASQTDAGLAGAEIAVGAVGTPDCMLQLDLQFPDIASLERFWHTLPAREHRAWLQRLQAVVSDHQGGPCWTVFHCIPCPVNAAELSTDAQASIPLNQGPTTPATMNTERRASAAESLSKAIASQLSHPATTPIPSLLDLPVASADSTTASSIILPGDDNYEAHVAQPPGSGEAGAGRSTRRRRSHKKSDSQSKAAPQIPLRVGGGIKIAAGGAPAGSRLAAMVGEAEYYETGSANAPDEERRDSQR